MPKTQAPDPGSLLAAFAHPTRLRILNLLHAGDLCVGDIVRLLDVPQPTASRHLGQLREAGLVSSRKEGLWIYYALAEPGSPFHAKLVECLACCFREVPELAADLTAARRLAKQGGCCPLHESGGSAGGKGASGGVRGARGAGRAGTGTTCKPPSRPPASRKAAATRGGPCCK